MRPQVRLTITSKLMLSGAFASSAWVETYDVNVSKFYCGHRELVD